MPRSPLPSGAPFTGRPACRCRRQPSAWRWAREMASELLLYGQRVVPTALDAHGFEFAHPGLDDALRWVLDRG